MVVLSDLGVLYANVDGSMLSRYMSMPLSAGYVWLLIHCSR